MSREPIGIVELVARRDELTLLDVRSSEEYRGLLGAPCDPRQGHIPGARHLPLELVLGLSDEALRSELALADGAEVVAYCHSGSRSALAVERLASLGYLARNYSGSWHEWSRSDEAAEMSPPG